MLLNQINHLPNILTLTRWHNKSLKSLTQPPEVTDVRLPIPSFPDSGMQPNGDFLPPNEQPITAPARSDTLLFRRYTG